MILELRCKGSGVRQTKWGGTKGGARRRSWKEEQQVPRLSDGRRMLDLFSKSGPSNLKKRRTHDKAGRLSIGQIVKDLKTLLEIVKDLKTLLGSLYFTLRTIGSHRRVLSRGIA